MISEPIGLDCFQELPATYLKNEAIRMYLDMFEPESSFFNNFLSAVIEIFVLCFLLFLFDLYLDIDLIFTYHAKNINVTNTNFSQLNEEFCFDGEITENKEDYRTATWISTALVIPSMLSYFIMTWTMFKIPKRFLVTKSPCWKWFLTIFNPVLYPWTYFVRNIKTNMDPKRNGLSLCKDTLEMLISTFSQLNLYNGISPQT